MLHILFVILKIVGIILAVILGILLLLVCIVLFVPICYRGEAESSGALEDIHAHVQVSWLFGLVKGAVDFKNKSPDFYIRIAWKKLGGRSESIQEEEESEYEGEKEHRESSEADEKALGQKEKEGKDSGGKEPWESQEEHSEAEERYGERKVVSEEKSGIREETGEDAEEAYEEEPEKSKEPVEEKRGKISFIGKIKEKRQGFILKIKQAAEKFKCTIRGLCDKIEEASEKKDKLKAFITDKTHVGALGKGKRELIKLLGHLSPKVFQADIHYGFEDPSLTGRALAGFGVLYPFLGDHVRITPDFQERVLEGSLRIKGRIYAVHLAALAVKLLLDREVRRTIKDVRNFKL